MNIFFSFYNMTCSKIFSGDLPEITSEIIQYFQNDFSTLHSCILVNRLWCLLAIPLLWENPFSIKKPKNYRLIEIYLHKFNNNDKLKLNEYGIITELFPSNTLFNYPGFIKCLDTFKVCDFIVTWAENAMVSNLDQVLNLSSFIFLSLVKIFIENEVNLHTIELKPFYTAEDIGSDKFNSAFQLILQNSNFINNVKNLSIHIDSFSNLSLFIKCFHSNYNSISSLYVYSIVDSVGKDLSKLINSQQNLNKIYFDHSNNSLKNLKISNCSNTLKTIIFRRIDLKNLEINFNEVFEQLNVLESVHILYCYSLDSTIIQQIINLTKPFKLKSLFMDERTTIQIESLKLLLQKSGNCLENIGFDSSIDNEFKLESFELVKIYCVKIQCIEILGFNDKNILPAFDLIENVQQNLNYLSINFSQFGYIYNSKYENKLSSIILRNLGQILPHRLEYLNLALKFNINDLEVFFINSQNTFIRKLLIRNKLCQERKVILPCIKQYVMKEKRVAYLAVESVPVRIKSGRKDLFYFKDEVEEFKLYGIQVTSYNNLYIQVCDFVNEMY